MTYIQDVMKQIIKDHKDDIERLQWALMTSVGSLVYAEFIRNIKKKEYPRRHIMVPPIKQVSAFLDKNGQLMQHLSSFLISDMMKNQWATKADITLLTNEGIGILNTVLELYIIPNIGRKIPQIISTKFQIGHPVVKGIIDESNEIDIFTTPLSRAYYDYIVEECCIQLLGFSPSMDKDMITPDDPANILLTDGDVLVVDHVDAICPIMITSSILANADIMNLLGFVAGLSFTYTPVNDKSQYVISSSNDNDIKLIRFNIV